jgi:hypothetical protein
MTPRERREQRRLEQERIEHLLEMHDETEDPEFRDELWSDIWAETNGFEDHHGGH